MARLLWCASIGIPPSVTCLKLRRELLRRGEAPEAGAKRELEEELGVVSGRLEKLSEFFVSPGFCEEKMWVYLATELQQKPSSNSTTMRSSRCVRIPFSQALSMITTGEIEDAQNHNWRDAGGAASRSLQCWRLPIRQSERAFPD